MIDSKPIWANKYPYIEKGVMQHKKRRMTKGQLVAKFKRKEDNMSPIIQTEVREGADDVSEGVAYEIINVEQITTDVQSLQGIRVTLQDLKGGEGNVMLWQRKVTGTGSKLGVFITHLGNNTDKWLHKWVKFNVWQDRKREIEIIPAPVPKAAKPKKEAAT